MTNSQKNIKVSMTLKQLGEMLAAATDVGIRQVLLANAEHELTSYMEGDSLRTQPAAKARSARGALERAKLKLERLREKV